MNEAARTEIVSEGGASWRRHTRADVAAWVTGLLARGIVLKIVVSPKDGAPTGSVVGTNDGKTPLRPEEIADLLWESMTGRSGVTVYELACFRSIHEPKYACLAPSGYEVTQVFSVGEPNLNPYPDQKVVETSISMQLARYADQLQARSIATFDMAFGAMQALKNTEYTRERDRNDRLERRLEHVEDREDRIRVRDDAYHAERVKRSTEERAAKLEDRQHELMFNMLNLAVPAMTAKMLPPGSGPAPLQGDALKDFLEDVSPSQWKRVMGVANLRPEQLIAFSTIQEAITQGKFPALADTVIEGFLMSFEIDQWQAIMGVMRPDQLAKLEPIVMAYRARKEAREGAPP